MRRWPFSAIERVTRTSYRARLPVTTTTGRTGLRHSAKSTLVPKKLIFTPNTRGYRDLIWYSCFKTYGYSTYQKTFEGWLLAGAPGTFSLQVGEQTRLLRTKAAPHVCTASGQKTELVHVRFNRLVQCE